ncbi:MAG: hypothetical protein WCX71_01510 [Candidatus Buchananbacteria bacterium]
MNEIDLLEKYYQSAISQDNEFNFFLGISDYVSFVNETPVFNQIVKENIVSQRIKLQNDIKLLHDKAVAEEIEAANRLIKILADNDIKSPETDECLREIDDSINNRVISTQTKAEQLADSVGDIISFLKNSDRSDLLTDFVQFYKDEPRVIKKYVYSATLPIYFEKSKEFEEQKQTSIWGAWNNLALVHLAITQKNEERKKLSEDKKSFFDSWNFNMLIGEMDKIRGDKYAQVKYHFFDKSKYASYLDRFHNYMLRYISQSKPAQISPVNLTKLSFFPENGLAEFRDIQATFKFGKKTNVLLGYLNSIKNTPVYLKEIQENCNSQIAIEKHKFKSEKDVRDTINGLKEKLKVKEGEFFPIYNKGKRFIWKEN